MFCLVLLIIPAGTVFAKSNEYDLSKTDSLTFAALSDGETYYVISDGTWGKITSAVSSDNKIATVDVAGDGAKIWIEPAGLGECKVTVIDEYSQKKEIKVTVAKNYIIGKMQSETSIWGRYYGSKKIRIETVPNCSGTLKVKNDTYPVSVGSSGEKAIKLKRQYKLGDKVTLKLKWNGLEFGLNSKIKSQTWSLSIKKVKKTLKVELHNLHKGDKVILKHKGKTYTKKIPKDYDSKTKYFTFKIQKPINGNGDKVVVTIKNKDGKRLNKNTYVLKKGRAEVEDDLDD